MREFFMSFTHMFASVWRNRQLVRMLARRDVQGRYRGSILGLAWTFLNPAILLCTYTFIFSVIFKAKWGDQASTTSEFAMIIFSGIIVYNLFAECIGRAPGLMIANANYVKKVVFPLEILPVVNIITALFHAAIGFAAWVLFHFIFLGPPSPTLFLFPVIMVPLLFYIAGFSWILSSLGVYFRDIMQIITLVLTVLMFLSPVFYPLSAVPEKLRPILLFNPLTVILEQMRCVLFGHPLAQWTPFMISGGIALCVAAFGFWFFQKTRRGFADVL